MDFLQNRNRILLVHYKPKIEDFANRIKWVYMKENTLFIYKNPQKDFDLLSNLIGNSREILNLNTIKMNVGMHIFVST